MNLKDQLKSSIIVNANTKKERERKRAEEYEKLKVKYKPLIDERLTALLSEAAKTSSDGWLSIEAMNIYICDDCPKTYASEVVKDLKLNKEYTITLEDVKAFCKKNKFKLKYIYTPTDSYDEKKYGDFISKKYYGDFYNSGLLNHEIDLYFHKYYIYVL